MLLFEELMKRTRRSFDRTSYFDGQFLPAMANVHPSLASRFHQDALNRDENTVRFRTRYLSEAEGYAVRGVHIQWLEDPVRGIFWVRGKTTPVGVVVRNISYQCLQKDKRPSFFYFFLDPAHATPNDSIATRNSYQALFATLAAQLRAYSTSYCSQTDALFEERPDIFETASLAEQFKYLFDLPLKSAVNIEAAPNTADQDSASEQKLKPIIIISGLHLCPDGKEIARLISHSFFRGSGPLLFLVTTLKTRKLSPPDNDEYFERTRVGLADLIDGAFYPGAGPMPEGEALSDDDDEADIFAEIDAWRPPPR